ncbi:MAG: carboxymuconolactone decarboxylase family protein [Gemmataceae bacterium]|nr:carboxymuconolactone decarboxylase family protein [Gemmataceae bacterium]
MPRIQPIDPATATGDAKPLLDQIQKSFGMVPNLMRTFAVSPATLSFFLQATAALSKSTLGPKVREQIDLVVSERNDCGYCRSAHTAIAKKLGLTDAQAEDARRGRSDDARTDAALKFAAAVIDRKGHVTDAELAAVRAGGLTEGEVADVIAMVSLKVFTNYFGHVAQPDIEFPVVPKLAAA